MNTKFELAMTTLAMLCQKSDSDMRTSLATMEERQYIERGGTGKGTYWTLNHNLHSRLFSADSSSSRRRIDWEAAKTRILSIARERQRHSEKGLTNSEVRAITQYDRGQAKRLMKQLEDEGVLELQGTGRLSVWAAK